MNIEQLIEKGEGLTSDFKQEVPRDLGKVIASFASTQGGAVLIGVDSNRDIVGVELSKIDNEQSRIDQAIQNVHPTCVCDYEQAAIQDKYVLILKVKKGSHPLYYYNYRPYIREGTSSRPATPDEVVNRVLDYYFVQGLRGARAELAAIKKMVEGIMPILELPTDAWRHLIQIASSDGHNGIVEQINSTYTSIMIWNSHGKIISNSINMENFNVSGIMNGPIGAFCNERNIHLAKTITDMISEIDHYLTRI